MLTCPNCKKKYRSNILVCPNCNRELLPPSAMKLRTDHPETADVKRGNRKIPPKKKTEDRPVEIYIDVLRGDRRETKEAALFLEKEGILCRVEQDEAFRFQYRLDGERQVSDPQGMVVRVPAFQLEKARALLDWETNKDDLHPGSDRALEEDEESTLVCPGCEAEVTPEEGACPECGWEFDLEDESDEEEYFCSTCGESCDPDDPVCPNCGAHFDH